VKGIGKSASRRLICDKP